MGAPATVPLRYVSIQDTDLVTSKLIVIDIYNRQNEEIGEISDVVIDGGKSVIGIVASVGGFLGIGESYVVLGESYVVLDPALITLADQDGKLKAFVDTSKDDLSKAPKLDYSSTRSDLQGQLSSWPCPLQGEDMIRRINGKSQTELSTQRAAFAATV